MPSIMSLEGPRITHLDEIRGQLYRVVPRQWWRAQAKLDGFSIGLLSTNQVMFALVFGVLGGAWLAGSKTGQKLVTKYGPKR